MGTARRLYLYGVSAVSLLVLSVGLYNLLTVVVGEALDAFGTSVIGGGGGIGREQVSLAIALVIVGLPVFAIHWTLVGRGWRGAGDVALEDRRSAIRAFHLGLVATVALVVAVVAALSLISESLEAAFGVERFGDAGWLANDLSLLIVALPIWWYHARRQNADLRHDRLTGAAASLTRLYRYGWAFAGLMLLVTGASGVIETLASVAIGRDDFGAADTWWREQLAWTISTVVVGIGLFWFHADDARRAIRDAAIIGEDDRVSDLRAGYFGAVILVALSFVTLSLATSLAGIGQWVLGVADGTVVSDFVELTVGPLLVTIPFAVAGWLHWAARRREAAGQSPVALASAERLSMHLAAGVGLTVLALGAGQLLGRVFEGVFGASVVDDLFGRETVWFVALVIVGGAVWVPAWSAVLRRRATDPPAERGATIGRAYLYLVVGASLVAAVPSAVFTLYRLIDTVLGGRGLALASDVAIPIAVVLVASVVAAYHGRLVVTDLRFATEKERAAAMEEPGAAAVGAPAAGILVTTGLPATGSLELVLSGPVDAVEAAAEDLRLRLPAGVTLERRVARPEPGPA